MEVDLEPEPSRRRNKRPTEGQGTGINVEENVDENDFPNDNDSYHSEELRSPISTDDEGDGNGREVFPQFNLNAEFGQVHLEIGMEFETLDIFKEAVRNFTIYHGRDIKWLKNDKERCRVVCKDETCNWMIYCAWSKVTKSFQIKTFPQPLHTCCPDFKSSEARRKWVVAMLTEKIKESPKITYTEAFDHFKTKYGMQINDTKLFRSLKEARAKVDGNFKEQ
jgi:hypothetical protein